MPGTAKMADPNNISQYKYAAMSNLVLQHDKRFSTRRNDEVTGDPESLAGRINIRDMGSRDNREAAPKSSGAAFGRGRICLKENRGKESEANLSSHEV